MVRASVKARELLTRARELESQRAVLEGVTGGEGRRGRVVQMDGTRE